MRVILASQSPRRKDFLAQMGIDFEVIVSEYPEIVDYSLELSKMALHFSKQKAKEVFEKTNGDRMVIGSDTTVIVDDKIYGKPKDKADAFQMLKSYCNRENLVVTGLCVMVSRCGIETVYEADETTAVYVDNMSDEEINNYIETGECFGKAGAYTLHGKFNVYVTKVEGNVSSVIGLPTNKLIQIFRQEGINLFSKNV